MPAVAAIAEEVDEWPVVAEVGRGVTGKGIKGRVDMGDEVLKGTAVDGLMAFWQFWVTPRRLPLFRCGRFGLREVAWAAAGADLGRLEDKFFCFETFTYVKLILV